MKALKPALGTIILSFSMTAFAAVAQTTNDNPANTGATATQEANSPGSANAQAGNDASQQRNNGAMSDEAREQRYEAEKKRCENLQGDEKDVCEKQAEANRDAAKADSERDAKKAEANRDANKEKKDAQFKVEKEKCEAMSGDAQDRCIAEVKTRFDR